MFVFTIVCVYTFRFHGDMYVC